MYLKYYMGGNQSACIFMMHSVFFIKKMKINFEFCVVSYYGYQPSTNYENFFFILQCATRLMKIRLSFCCSNMPPGEKKEVKTLADQLGNASHCNAYMYISVLFLFFVTKTKVSFSTNFIILVLRTTV